MTIEPKRFVARLFGKGVRVTDRSLLCTNFIFSGVYLAQAVAIALLSKAYYRPLFAHFLTDDTLQSQLTHHPVSALASHQLLTLNIAWLAVAALVTLAVYHLLQATVCKEAFLAGVRRGNNSLRWIFYSAAYFLLLAATGMLAGVSDIAVWIQILALATVLAVSGITMDLHTLRTKRKPSSFSPYSWLTLVSAKVPILIILLYIAFAHIFGNGRVLSAYLYTGLATFLVLIAAFSINRYLMSLKKAAWREYAYGELWYMLLAMVLVTAVSWQIFAAVLRP
jgi:hypothetical protein